MQAINRIQNAMINANANAQAALVVDAANAHRAYPSFKPCDSSLVSKCSLQSTSSPTPPTTTCLPVRPDLVVVEGSGCLMHGPVGGQWRRERHHLQMPATMWATVVLNRQMRG